MSEFWEKYKNLIIFVIISFSIMSAAFCIGLSEISGIKSNLWGFLAALDTSTAIALAVLAFMAYMEYAKGEDEIKLKFEILDEDGNVLNSQILDGIEPAEVNQTERELLLFIREEEKLARDVYITLNNKWGDQTNVFENIRKAEQTHTDLIQELLERYDIPDPVTNEDEVGKFENQDLQDLYDKLINKGERSLEDALEVGATIEDYDIKDLEDSIVQTDNEDFKVVFQGLIDGSDNHMRGFLKALSQEKGYSSTNPDLYKPQFISQERYDQIFETNPNNSVGTTANGEAPPSIPEE